MAPVFITPYPFFWNLRRMAGRRDKSFNLYMVKNGEEGQNSYVISYYILIQRPPGLSRLSIDPIISISRALAHLMTWRTYKLDSRTCRRSGSPELIFNSLAPRDLMPEIVSYKNAAVPVGTGSFEEVIDYISGCKMTDFALSLRRLCQPRKCIATTMLLFGLRSGLRLNQTEIGYYRQRRRSGRKRYRISGG